MRTRRGYTKIGGTCDQKEGIVSTRIFFPQELLEQMGEEAKRNWELHKKKSTKKDGNIFKRFLGGNKSTGQAGTKSPAEETVPESPFGGIKPTQSPSPSSLSPVISARQELSRGTSPYNSKNGSKKSLLI